MKRHWLTSHCTRRSTFRKKPLEVFKELPTQQPGKTAPQLAKTKKNQRSTEVYLKDLYEAGVAYCAQLPTAGSPWGYWVNAELRKEILALISEAGGIKLNSEGVAQNFALRGLR